MVWLDHCEIIGCENEHTDVDFIRTLSSAALREERRHARQALVESVQDAANMLFCVILGTV